MHETELTTHMTGPHTGYRVAPLGQGVRGLAFEAWDWDKKSRALVLVANTPSCRISRVRA